MSAMPLPSMIGTRMIKSTFRAYDHNGFVIYHARVSATTFDEHDARIDTLIRITDNMGAARFEVVSK